MAAARRVRQPGCKFDNILVLEGTQGSGKSTALRILAGADNFSDQDILALDPKAQMEAVEGVWIYELGELEGLPRADTNKVKAFASRAIDRARPAYGRFRDNRPRQNIFVGTTNDDHYLRDMTGNRRFWPVRTSVIDLAALERDRDQLWAEAASVEASGASITLDETLWPAAKEQQDARMEDDPWMDALRNIQVKNSEGTSTDGHAEMLDGYYRISTNTILTSVLMIELDKQSAWQSKRIAQIMRVLGWEGPTNLKSAGKVTKGYRMLAKDSEAKITFSPKY